VLRLVLVCSSELASSCAASVHGLPVDSGSWEVGFSDQSEDGSAEHGFSDQSAESKFSCMSLFSTWAPTNTFLSKPEHKRIPKSLRMESIFPVTRNAGGGEREREVKHIH
jgi:hypothetical protein